MFKPIFWRSNETCHTLMGSESDPPHNLEAIRPSASGRWSTSDTQHIWGVSISSVRQSVK